MKKIFLMLFLFIPFLRLNAKTLDNYNYGVSKVNNYIIDFSDYDIYLVTENNVPYLFNNGLLSVNENFEKGGFLNLLEFNTSKDINNETYLYDGTNYFTMSESSEKVYNITSNNQNNYELINKSDRSGYRVTEYINDYINVTGSGTYSNPWEFIKPEYRITLNITNAKIDNQNSYVKTINKNKASYNIIPNNNYILDKIVCEDGTFDYSLNNDVLNFTNIKSNITCDINYIENSYYATINITNGTLGSAVNGNLVGNVLEVNAHLNGSVNITPTTGYAFDTISCSNDQVVSYNSKVFTIANISSNTTCNLSFENAFKSFAYLEIDQTYTVPETGYYNIEGYGAQGGGTGGKGGYVQGKVYLEKGDTIYVNTGGINGYNGGGAGLNKGGGATTFKLDNAYIMIAAGGGGGASGSVGGSDTGAGGVSAGTGSTAGSSGINGGGGGSSTTGSSRTCSTCTEEYNCVETCTQEKYSCTLKSCDPYPDNCVVTCTGLCCSRQNCTEKCSTRKVPCNCVTTTLPSNPGKGGSNFFETNVTNITNTYGLRSGNGMATISFES